MAEAAPPRAAELHSPAQALPAANSTTVRSRWARWALLTAQGPGAKWTANADTLAETLEQVPWRTMVVCRDNLAVNDCVVAAEERLLQWRRENGGGDKIPCLLSVNCCCHSAVLAQRPLLNAVRNLPGIIVKLGHLLESHRTQERFEELLDKHIIKKSTSKSTRMRPGFLPSSLLGRLMRRGSCV